jgi:hypothetical protein
MEASPGNQQLLTALTTEHFGLQGSRASTVSESSSRSALYLGAVSSTLIALGFFANIGGTTDDAFRVFALTALTTVFVLGVFTYIRLVQSSVEDLFYGRAINRIRHHYLELAGEKSELFMLTANDDALGVVRNMAVQPSHWQLYFTNATAIAVVNAVIGGGAIALAVGIATGAALGVSSAVGGAFAIAYLSRATRWERRYHEQSAGHLDVLFPSPQP